MASRKGWVLNDEEYEDESKADAWIFNSYSDYCTEHADQQPFDETRGADYRPGGTGKVRFDFFDCIFCICGDIRSNYRLDCIKAD